MFHVPSCQWQERRQSTGGVNKSREEKGRGGKSRKDKLIEIIIKKKRGRKDKLIKENSSATMYCLYTVVVNLN